MANTKIGMPGASPAPDSESSRANLEYLIGRYKADPEILQAIYEGGESVAYKIERLRGVRVGMPVVSSELDSEMLRGES